MKMLMNSVCTFLSVVPIDFIDGAHDFDVDVNESIFLSFVRPMTHMNVSSHYWSPFHANHCVFLGMNSKRCH